MLGGIEVHDRERDREKGRRRASDRRRRRRGTGRGQPKTVRRQDADHRRRGGHALRRLPHDFPQRHLYLRPYRRPGRPPLPAGPSARDLELPHRSRRGRPGAGLRPLRRQPLREDRVGGNRDPGQGILGLDDPGLGRRGRRPVLRGGNRRRRHVERHRRADQVQRDLLVRRAALDRDDRRHPAVLGHAARAGAPGILRYRARRVRRRRGDLPDHHLRHADAQLHRHALRADRHVARRRGGHVADHGTDPPGRGPRPGDHRDDLPDLRLHRPTHAGFPPIARDFLAAVLQPSLYRRRDPGTDDRRVVHLHNPVHHLRRLPAGVQGRRLFRQLRLRGGGARARRPGQGRDLRLRASWG
jgi:hypothetical protein